VFGSFAASQGSVLIIDEENSERLLQERVFKLGALADLPIYFSNSPGFVLNDDNVEAALRNCKTHDIKLVIIDSLVRVHASDENSAGDMSGVFKQLKRFTANDITVLVTHHNRKPGANNGSISNEMRGSSDILASVDCHIGLRRKSNSLTLYQAKNRYAEELEPFEVNVVTDDESFKFEYQGEMQVQENRSQVIKNAVLKLLSEHDKLFQKELLVGLDKFGVKTNEHKLRELLKHMVAYGTVLETAGLGKTKYYSLGAEANDE
jgi:predicted ATP-dependent serine protease